MRSAAVPVIRTPLKSDSFRSQMPTDGSGLEDVLGWHEASTAKKNGSAVLPPYPRGSDGQPTREEGSHQRVVQEDLGQTSLVRRQGLLRLVLTFIFQFQLHIKSSKYILPLFSLYNAARSHYIEISGQLNLKEDCHLTDAKEMLGDWFQQQTMVVDALFHSKSVPK